MILNIDFHGKKYWVNSHVQAEVRSMIPNDVFMVSNT